MKEAIMKGFGIGMIAVGFIVFITFDKFFGVVLMALGAGALFQPENTNQN